MLLRLHRWALLGILAIVLSNNVGEIPFSSLYAQENANPVKTILVRSYSIRKIYTHRLGYRIDIRDYHGRIRTIYAKISWFSNMDQRNQESDDFELSASLNYIPAASGLLSNYLTLRYEDGKAVSLVIYADEPNYTNSNDVWFQAIAPYDKMDEKFEINTIVFSDPPAPGNIPAAKPEAPGNAEAEAAEQ